MISTAQSFHLKDIVRLGERYYSLSPYVKSHEFEPATLLDWLRKAMIYPNAEVAVATYNDQVVGVAVAYLLDYAWTSGHRANMEFFYVDEEYRQYGLAEQLLEHQVEWAKKMNCLEFIAGDIGLNPRLNQKFFEQHGFQDPGMVIRKVLI